MGNKRMQLAGAGALAAAVAGALGGADAVPDRYRVDVAGMDRTIAPGRRLLRVRQRRLDEGDGDPARSGRLRRLHDHRRRGHRAAAGAARGGREGGGAPDDSAVLAKPSTRRTWTRRRSRSAGSRAGQAELDEIAKIADRAALARVLGSAAAGRRRRAQPHATSTPTGSSACGPRRTSPIPSATSPTCCRAASACPTATTTEDRRRSPVELQTKYRAHIAAVLRARRSVPDAEARGGRIYDLEKKIADVHVSRTDSVDVHKANNPWPPSEFPTRAPGLDWKAYFDAAGLSSQPMIMVWHPVGDDRASRRSPAASRSRRGRTT